MSAYLVEVRIAPISEARVGEVVAVRDGIRRAVADAERRPADDAFHDRILRGDAECVARGTFIAMRWTCE